MENEGKNEFPEAGGKRQDREELCLLENSCVSLLKRKNNGSKNNSTYQTFLSSCNPHNK